jgi:hypothetical protein
MEGIIRNWMKEVGSTGDFQKGKVRKEVVEGGDVRKNLPFVGCINFGL